MSTANSLSGVGPDSRQPDAPGPRIRGGRLHTTPYLGNTLFGGGKGGGLARIVASGRLASESAGRTYILVYRAMAKLYRP